MSFMMMISKINFFFWNSYINFTKNVTKYYSKVIQRENDLILNKFYVFLLFSIVDPDPPNLVNADPDSDPGQKITNFL